MPDTPEIERYIANLNAEKARLESEKAALIAEFTNSIPDEWSPDDLKQKMKDLYAKAYARISMTIDNDDEPKLAFDASKYVMSIGIGATKITDDNDPNKELNDLIKSIAPQKAKASNGDDTSTT